MIDPVALTQRLIAFDTTNPPGQEQPCASFLAELLRDGGFDVRMDNFEPGRANVVARLADLEGDSPLVFSGHLDTVPNGMNAWATNPFQGVIRGDKLYGRGASDMKSGVAAMVAAALELAAKGSLRRGLTVILTAGEEVGCAGACHLVTPGHNLGNASALLVGEPTANQPAIAHKGALYMNANAQGVAAHSSMPEKGVNAIYKAARAVGRIETFQFAKAHPLMGSPTINVGKIAGGMNVNSVPDAATFTIDVRSIAGQKHLEVITELRQYLGPEIDLVPFVDMPPVATDPSDGFVECVLAVLAEVGKQAPVPIALPFFSDASVLQPALKCPVVILGPGEPAMAHQTDEFCYVDKIGQAAATLVQIALSWDRRTKA